MKKLLITLTAVIIALASINFIFGTLAIQKLQLGHPSSFECTYYYENICQKNFGFDAWLAFFFIPLLTAISVYFSLKEKINPFLSGVLSIFSWILILELLTQVLHIPALYHSLERSSLNYSIFFVQTPIAIYSGGIIISDQLQVLAILLLISLFVGYICYKIYSSLSKHNEKIKLAQRSTKNF